MTTDSLGQFNVPLQLTSARVVSVSNLDATYANGPSNNGVHATLRSNVIGRLVIDGVTLNDGDRVLVNGQTSEYENGIYVVTYEAVASTKWILQRADDFQNIAQIRKGMYIPIDEGTTYASSMWIIQPPLPNAIGVDAINFVNIATIPLAQAPQTQILTGSGTYTTPANALYLLINMSGAGGGGEGSSTDGTQGAGGNGGNTTFGSFTAGGGKGGGGVSKQVGGLGGTTSSGNLQSTNGGNGGGGVPSGINSLGGTGGGGITSTLSMAVGGVAGITGGTYGSGGSGASGSATIRSGAGGGGGARCIILETAPPPTIAYSKGAGGSAGTAGTGGFIGGGGGNGFLSVTAYFQ